MRADLFPQGPVVLVAYQRCVKHHNTMSKRGQYRDCPACGHFMAEHNSEGRCEGCQRLISHARALPNYRDLLLNDGRPENGV